MLIAIYNFIGGEQIKNILIIEDDKALSNGIVLALQGEGIAFVQSFSIKSARENTKDGRFDLLIADINLRDASGLDFLREIKRKCATPVVILTANDMETDVVTGLEMGGRRLHHKAFQPCGFARAREHTASQASTKLGAI